MPLLRGGNTVGGLDFGGYIRFYVQFFNILKSFCFLAMHLEMSGSQVDAWTYFSKES